MNFNVKTETEINIKYLLVSAGVRYWEDATVNGKEDTEGDLIPCRNGDYWCPFINIETGQIVNWTMGVEANIHYKVCDDGTYSLEDEDGNEIVSKDMYVPECLFPKENGYGDYIIMDVNKNGYIDGWFFNPEKFMSYESF